MECNGCVEFFDLVSLKPLLSVKEGNLNEGDDSSGRTQLLMPIVPLDGILIGLLIESEMLLIFFNSCSISKCKIVYFALMISSIK
jgi:hypothetical protein